MKTDRLKVIKVVFSKTDDQLGTIASTKSYPGVEGMGMFAENALGDLIEKLLPRVLKHYSGLKATF